MSGQSRSIKLAGVDAGDTFIVENPAVSIPAIEARGISHYFRAQGGWLQALDDVSLAVGSGEFVSVIGPSACGKSTLLNILTGLQVPAAGDVRIDGRTVTGQLGITGYMPQKDLLMPWKTVLDNTCLGLELAGTRRRRAREAARAWFPRFGLEGFDRVYPAALSGGMRQRAALLRTFLAGREILLLDEPFGALDALTRAVMQEWLLDVWSDFGKTILLVTHDIDEAIFLSDLIYVMTPRPGRIARTFRVPFSRPRAYEDTVTSNTFGSLKRDLLALLKQRPDGGSR